MLVAAAVKFVSRKKIISLTPKCRLFFSYQTVHDPVILAMPLVLGQNIRTQVQNIWKHIHKRLCILFMLSKETSKVIAFAVKNQ